MICKMEIEDHLKYQSGLQKDIVGTDGVAQRATWKGTQLDQD